MTKDEVLNKYAVGAILSDSNEVPYDTLIETLENGEVPDGVSIWHPFENHEYYEIAELIQEQRDILKCFAEDWDGANNG